MYEMRTLNKQTYCMLHDVLEVLSTLTALKVRRVSISLLIKSIRFAARKIFIPKRIVESIVSFSKLFSSQEHISTLHSFLLLNRILILSKSPLC